MVTPNGNLNNEVVKGQDVEPQVEGVETLELGEEDVQKLTALKAAIDAEREKVRIDTEAKMQSVKDREVGRVRRDRQMLEGDLKATQAGLSFIIESVSKGMEPEEFQKFQAGMATRVQSARAAATQLPPQEEAQMPLAQMKAAELARNGIRVDFRNPVNSDPRLDFTLPSTFIETADAILAETLKPNAPVVKAKEPQSAVQPPVPDESGKRGSVRAINADKVREQYAMGLTTTENYMKQCEALGIQP